MKFGGTSVRDDASRFSAMKHIQQNVDNGKKVVVVVSAMGRQGEPYATDTLISLLKNVEGNASICPQELDLVMSCGEILSASYFSHLINQHNLPGIAFTGAQAGILTDDNAGQAEILNINPMRILQELDKGKIPVVAGFQGANSDGDVRTLGRGGSDTSAVALGSALNAEKVEIFSDVDGIANADPRQVENAEFLSEISVQQILTMADEGSKVIHPRAVKASLKTQTPIVARNTFNNTNGTTIYHGDAKQNTVSIAHRDNLVMVEFENSVEISNISDIITINDNKYLIADDVYLEEKLGMMKSLNQNFKTTKQWATISVIFGQSKIGFVEIANAKIINSNNKIIRYLLNRTNLTESICKLFNHYIKTK
ncbi:MAG: aspartate kinase [Candidatus Marinimicrobia bacterium]|nr:aspartate kinase [Candidatus Neomarinimicrobiota bacterium]MBL7023796.1 aspartate kinase [Candidatus Neomarinimicrobiota bacterium]MBL7108736.1 aspartate kinase [Candidatus Neomarinimicrobiota bacterium]